MQKSEFLERVDSYFRRKRVERWSLSVLSVTCLLTAFEIQPISNFIINSWSFSKDVFLIIGGLSGGAAIKTWLETGSMYLLHSAKDIINGENDI
ncbi:hypothetical protein HII17_04250 [Thalassotalea sp. M1531]|uniref:Uncharacterized protein n=1 Tax=Thalassotalea algicola TaxID=2716224 RepID=A0A7Y0LBQ5_9GAMM|nr:hypothetical protein [Thalassotalea algicola]NMP30766.1 hypothetical protein [Thalassotalea algicola]